MNMSTPIKIHKKVLAFPAIFLFLVVVMLFLHGQAFGLTVNYLSSIPTGNGDPIRIAADNTGTLYVAAPGSGKILKYAQDGSSAGSINGFVKPISVAVDSLDRVYVGDSQDRSVNVVSSDGQALFSLGKGKGEFGMPGAIAIASNGSVYVTDSPNNVVKVYGSDGAYQFSFGGYGTGAGQMIFPTGIASDNANQQIYVVDYTNGRVEVFDLNGAFRGSFGSYGSGQGKLTRPQGIHVSGGKVYVADAFQSAVEVFDTNGNFLSFAGQFGTGQGNLKIPMDVTTIGTTLFVSNSDNRRIEVFDIVDPQGLTIAPSTLSFTASVNNNPAGQTLQINPEVAGSTPAWTAAVSSPFTIQLSSVAGTSPSTVTVNVDTAGLSPGVYMGGVIVTANGTSYPVSVNLAITQPQQQLLVSAGGITLTYQDGILSSQKLVVNSSSGVLSWSAATNLPWLTLSPAAGTTPGSITAVLNDKVNALNDGTYSGTITVAAPNAAGSPATVPVTLTVVRQKLLASPAGIDMSHQTDGELATSSLSIGSGSGSLDWTATGDAQWFTLSSSSGTTPGSITVALNSNANTLSEGTYNSSVTVTAPYAVNSPVTVPVTLKVVVAGTIIVNTNLDGASFTITGTTPAGAATYTGSGKSWKTDGARPAIYSIQFDHVKGHRRPATRSFEVNTGKVATIDVQYQALPVANVIAAAKGPGEQNDDLVRVLDRTGAVISEFHAFPTPGKKAKYGARVVMADIDGDGTSEIIVVPGEGYENRAAINVFRGDGTLLSSLNPIGGTVYGANVASGDILGDGAHEVAMSMITTSKVGSTRMINRTVVIYQFNGYPLVEKTRINLPGVPAEQSGTPVQAGLALGDVDGDGILELIVSNERTVGVYAFDDAFTATLLTSRSGFVLSESPLNVSAGDVDGDGVDEVIIGYTDDPGNAYVGFFDADLQLKESAIRTFPGGGSTPNLSAMDWTGDGAAEILVGKGVDEENDSTLRVYDLKGTVLKQIRVFGSSVRYGVSAAFGVKE